MRIGLQGKKTTAENYQYGNRQLSVWKSPIISMEIDDYQHGNQ